MTESTDKQLPDEQPLDEYLKGDSSVSRQYRQLPNAEVPAELDLLVLRKAEDAVKRGAYRGRPSWVRWTAPLAVAASAVLVVSIVIETGVRDETAVLYSPPATMQARERGVMENEAEEAGESIDSEEAAPASAPPAEVASDSLIQERLDERAALRRAPAEPQQEATPAAPPPAAPSEEGPQAFAQKRAAPPPVAAPVPTPTPAPAPAVMPARSVSRAAQDAARVLNASALDEAARKQSATADEAKAAAQEAKQEAKASAAPLFSSREVSATMPPPQFEYTDPEAWLRDIRELRKENKQDQADREWRRFREAFPNHEVAETDTAREPKK